MDAGFEIRESPIHGLGVFATKHFAAGDVVNVWDTSHVLTEDSIKKLPESERLYVAKYNDSLILMQAPSRYFNHSCEPNTQSNNARDVAIRDIQIGDEITTDYRPEMQEGETMVCQCGAEKCTGLIQV